MMMWNQLLKTLDRLFGFTGKGVSAVKKLKQEYDDETQEHVILLEYRMMLHDTEPMTSDPKGSEYLRVKQETGLRILDAISTMSCESIRSVPDARTLLHCAVLSSQSGKRATDSPGIWL